MSTQEFVNTIPEDAQEPPLSNENLEEIDERTSAILSLAREASLLALRKVNALFGPDQRDDEPKACPGETSCGSWSGHVRKNQTAAIAALEQLMETLNRI